MWSIGAQVKKLSKEKSKLWCESKTHAERVCRKSKHSVNKAADDSGNVNEQEHNWFCFVGKKGSDPKHDEKDNMPVDTRGNLPHSELGQQFQKFQ